MSTSADEALDKAKSHIRQATKELSMIVIDEIWGHDEFRKEYRTKIMNAMLTLIEVGMELDS